MNKKAMDVMIKDLKVDDLGYIVREVLKNKETLYYSNQLKIDANNKFMMIACIGSDDSQVLEGLGELNTGVFEGIYDCKDTCELERHCLTREEDKDND